MYLSVCLKLSKINFLFYPKFEKDHVLKISSYISVLVHIANPWAYYHFISFNSHSQETIYYINQNNPSNSPDGTENNPYASLAEAIQGAGSGQFEFVLLGDNITLNTDLSIPTGSNYTIR